MSGHFPNGATAIITNCDFYRNEALIRGGSIWLSTNLTLTGALYFDENFSPNGNYDGPAYKIYQAAGIIPAVTGTMHNGRHDAPLSSNDDPNYFPHIY